MRRIPWPFPLAFLAVVVALALPARAAESGRGYYFNIGPSYALIADSKLSDGPDLSVDDGFGAAIAVGYRFRNGFRGEVEAGFRRNDLSRVSAAGTFFGTAVSPSTSLAGDVMSIYGMANLYYDIDLGSNWAPYVGFGIGGTTIQIDSPTFEIDQGDTVFAYQGMAGLTYRVSPNVWAHGGYRYFTTGNPEIRGTNFEYQSHVLEIGLQIGFVAF